MQGWRTAIALQRDSNTNTFLWILWNFEEHLFWRTSANRCFCTSNHNVNNYKYWTSDDLFLIKNITSNGFYYEGLYNQVRIYFLMIVCINHSNRVNIVLISIFRQIYAGSYPLHNVYFNDMQINRWQNFKDKGNLFKLILPMTTKIHRISFLRTFFFISLDKSALLHRRCCLMSKFPEIDTVVQKNILFFIRFFMKLFPIAMVLLLYKI